MYSNSEYSSLLAKYNRAVGENLSLKDQLRQNNQRMSERETEIKHDNDLIRGLCEEILAKDNSEMVVGTEYSWSRMSIYELIERTTSSYRKYNRERSELMMQLADLAEERAEQIAGLCEQIEQMQHMYSELDDSNRGPDIKPEKVVDVPKVQAATETPEEKPMPSCESITIEDRDVTDSMTSTMVDAIKISESVKITPPSIPVSEPRKLVEKVKKEREKAHKADKIDLMDLNKTISKFNPAMKEIVHIIGETGFSFYLDIHKKFCERCKDLEIGTSEPRIRAAIDLLTRGGIIHQDSFDSPLKGKIKLMKLSASGGAVYKELFGSTPVVSELDRIILEHDNTQHGYGIRELAEILEASGKYKSVTWMNGRQPIALENGQSVIPDIIARTNRYIEYFEYERANHTYPDFQAKLSKLSHISKFINIIVQNINQLDAILKDVERWGKESGASKQRKVIVRMSTVKYYATHEPGTRKGWFYEYNTETGQTTNLSEKNETAQQGEG